MPRVSILEGEEKLEFDSPPLFNSAERKRFFATPSKVESILESLRTPTNQVWFLLMLGYFKASARFYRSQVNEADVQYVARKLGFFRGVVDDEPLDESTYRRHRSTILDYLGWQSFDAHAERDLVEHVQPMIRSQSRPKSILARAIDFLAKRKAEVPTLRTLNDAILGGINNHKSDLTNVVNASLDQNGRQFLDDLLAKDDISSGSEELQQRYRLTLLKNASQSTKVNKIKAATQDLSA